MNATFLACATVVIYRRFDPDKVLTSIGKNRVTMFFAVPTIYINLLNIDLGPYDLSSVRYEFSAAATMPREIIEFCRQNMAAYKVPAEVEFIDELPKSPTGKILKRVLRDQEK